MTLNTVSIRHYQPTDQSDIFRIASDTAFFGEPVEAFLEDRNLYNDAFARYYTVYETSLVWVAEDTGGMIGFLLGCADTSVQAIKWRGYIIRTVLLRAISGKYRLGKRTGSFAVNMLMGKLRGEEPAVNVNEYPAHLQIDVKQGFRGEGVGKRLIEAYLDQLHEMKVRGVHLETTSHNEAACHLYEKIGFGLLDEHPNRFWTHMLGFAVSNRSYGLELK